MKTSTVLKRAKKVLAKDDDEIRYTTKEAFICYSIYIATDDDDKVCDRVAAIVQKRLDPYITLETWLEYKHNISRVYSNEPPSRYTAYRNKVQQTRHAWIDSMIEEFAAKGD